LLDEIFSGYGNYTPWELVDLTHSFPEWKEPEGSAVQITYEDILRAVGRGEESAELVEDIEAHNAFKRALRSSAQG
jgi:hypothetical protein